MSVSAGFSQTNKRHTMEIAPVPIAASFGRAAHNLPDGAVESTICERIVSALVHIVNGTRE